MKQYFASALLAVFGVLISTVHAAGQSPGAKPHLAKDWPLPNNATLIQEYRRAAIVLVGTFAKGEKQSTEFVIGSVLKPHELVKNINSFRVSQDLPEVKNGVLLFCDDGNDAIEPYCAIELEPGGDLVKYLKEAIAFKDKSTPARLRLCFNFLNSKEWMVAGDAFREFAQADYKDYKEMAKRLPPDTIAGWLKDKNIHAEHAGLYGLLLGNCGKTEHAEVLRAALANPALTTASTAKNLLAAYTMLAPKEGLTDLTNILLDGSKKFWLRYEAVRALRFLREERPDLVTQADVVASLRVLLDQSDIADFAIHDLRRMKQWDLTDAVLEQFGKKSHDSNIVRRAILQFALQSPEPRAAAFVQEQRGRDPQWVRDAEEMLKGEN